MMSWSASRMEHAERIAYTQDRPQYLTIGQDWPRGLLPPLVVNIASFAQVARFGGVTGNPMWLGTI